MQVIPRQESMSQQYYQQFEQPRFRFARPAITWAVQRLILLNIAIFALQLVLDIPLSWWLDPLLGQFSGFYPYHLPGGVVLNTVLGYQSDLFLAGQVWKPLTYQFLHGGLTHLFWNMLLLFFFGPGLERVLGTPQFFRFYIVCGVVAVLANLVPDSLALFSGQAMPSVTGASGAVMGVVVAFVVIDLDRQYFLFPFPVPINGRALLLILIVINVLYALMETTVSVPTHFGGMAFGYVYMKLLPRWNAWRRERRLRARPARAGKKRNKNLDNVGRAVDNIFKFDDDDRS